MIFLGADHAGFELKEKIKSELTSLGYEIKDLGNLKLDPKDDYPDFAADVAEHVAADKNNKGILFCGSAQGVCVVANKFAGIRGVTAPTVGDAQKTREHNDANVLCLSGWYADTNKAKAIITAWLETPFSGEERHVRRLKKIEKIEKASAAARKS